MLLHLGHEFDSIVYAPPSSQREGEYFAGPSKLLLWLEGQLGLSGYRSNTAYLRIELYRQALGQHLAETAKSSAPFFDKSFAADRFASAEALLAWRDELLLAGWDFALFPHPFHPASVILLKWKCFFKRNSRTLNWASRLRVSPTVMRRCWNP